MRYIVAISGPVAVGKSALANEFISRFGAHRISTRTLLIDAGAKDDRADLIDTGKRLDIQTDGAWLRDGVQKQLQQHPGKDIVLVDSVRTPRQIEHMRDAYGEKFIHVHLSAPYDVVKERYVCFGME